MPARRSPFARVNGILETIQYPGIAPVSPRFHPHTPSATTIGSLEYHIGIAPVSLRKHLSFKGVSIGSELAVPSKGNIYDSLKILFIKCSGSEDGGVCREDAVERTVMVFVSAIVQATCCPCGG